MLAWNSGVRPRRSASPRTPAHSVSARVSWIIRVVMKARLDCRMCRYSFIWVDLLEPGDQVEFQQPGDAEPDERGAVGIDVVGLDAHAGAVPHRALDHGVHLGGRALQELAVNRHRPGVSTVQ